MTDTPRTLGYSHPRQGRAPGMPWNRCRSFAHLLPFVQQLERQSRQPTSSNSDRLVRLLGRLNRSRSQPLDARSRVASSPGSREAIRSEVGRRFQTLNAVVGESLRELACGGSSPRARSAAVSTITSGGANGASLGWSRSNFSRRRWELRGRIATIQPSCGRYLAGSSSGRWVRTPRVEPGDEPSRPRICCARERRRRWWTFPPS